MGTVAGFLSTSDQAPVGEWANIVIKRKPMPEQPPMPTVAELRKRFRGSFRKARGKKPKHSPKQAAKVRWKSVRRRAAGILLLSREFARRSPILRLFKAVSNKDGETFNWYERDPYGCS